MKIVEIRIAFGDKINLGYDNIVPYVELKADLEHDDDYDDAFFQLQQAVCKRWLECAIVRLKEQMAIRVAVGRDLTDIPVILEFLITQLRSFK